ncbi:penicillin-binding protein 1A [Noviherbaspirillum pedocola]|uniref:Transglycosylase domain-containing protein n=1 Tax=Noviherbaspirillum pedocola TaxID=2801341 RepID=A0A934W8Y1_9BURK|nr:transglycosylase domain-containing protein [Noviherbaspirillum pedocola]MBK4736374.1 transglycosylase domain-containing protein [Noviherbaspirillum pedocola]
MENKKPPRRRGWLPAAAGALFHAVKVIAVAGFASALILAVLAWTMIRDMPFTDRLPEVRAIKPSVIRAADGSELAVLRSLQREWVPLSRVSPDVIHALISTEDQRFYQHHGVDFARTVSAVLHTAGGETQGGSTITQQLVRNLYPQEVGRQRTVTRKLKEMVTALRVEERYGKDAILETYLNTVPFLYNVYGIEMAARTYFGKSAAELGPREAATLVGMLKGTHYYNPIVNPARAKTRRNVVLGQMLRHGYLAQGVYQDLCAQELGVRFQRPVDDAGNASHFVEYVRRFASDWAERNGHDLGAEGLVIQTTLDPKLQALAVKSVERQTAVLQAVAGVEWARPTDRPLSEEIGPYLSMASKVEPFRNFWRDNPALEDSFLKETPEFRREAKTSGEAAALRAVRHDKRLLAQVRAAKTRLEAGFVAIDPASSEVKAWVGSRDFATDQYDHVAQAARQPGSTFKPFVYGAALERGFAPERPYTDAAIEIRLPDGKIWRPTDMGGPTGRIMTLRDGLVFSRNSITAQVMRDVGVPDIADLARRAGIRRSRLDPVPSLALGTSPVTLLEMAGAYATIARGGVYREPIVVSRITDRNGTVIAQFDAPPTRVLSEGTDVQLIDMMRDVIRRGTGTLLKKRFATGADVAGKTGTTQNNTDGWFMLMHPQLVVGSWVGFNDARVTMRSAYWGQGGHNALLLAGDFFQAAAKAGLVDVGASFPQLPRQPVIAALPQAGEPDEHPGILITAETPEAGATTVESASGITDEADDVRITTATHGMPAGPRDKPPLNDEQVSQLLAGMGRDPVTGARLAARQAVETNPPQSNRMSGSSGAGSVSSGDAEEVPAATSDEIR